MQSHILGKPNNYILHGQVTWELGCCAEQGDLLYSRGPKCSRDHRIFFFLGGGGLTCFTPSQRMGGWGGGGVLMAI